MKRNKFFKTGGLYLALIMLVASFSLTSCLKDNGPGSVNFGKSPALVAFQYAGIGNVPYVMSIHNVNTVTTNVEVSLSVASITQSTPVTGTVVVDQDSSASYVKHDTAGGNVDHILPTSLYSIANGGKFTIAPGTQFASIPITLAGDKIDFTQNYILVLKITGASGAQLTTNLNYATLIITLQSIYQGTYTVTGSFVDKTNATITDDKVYPLTVKLQTLGALQVQWDDASNGYEHLINSAGQIGYYGNFSPIFTFNTTGKITAVTNHYGQGSNSSGRSAALDPTGTNAVTSGTPGTTGFAFQVSYILVQSGSNRTYFNETFTYTGP
ncbi:DUF1735 domain-containing protein [Mucilaginibacter sp. X5P1]|uniref:DUF1735 domain-containing protein n=1 Tax=Mucilaginibacter sp. X5P1 TaxID=2723088 RepID=UPI00160B9A2F|nr:DUF1735 domain-containing protein [Mucilaginibacter sp. X5P1]MBB6139962.1 hypothetical protein [Mucilaginibacter sp. X5P1]